MNNKNHKLINDKQESLNKHTCIQTKKPRQNEQKHTNRSGGGSAPMRSPEKLAALLLILLLLIIIMIIIIIMMIMIMIIMMIIVYMICIYIYIYMYIYVRPSVRDLRGCPVVLVAESPNRWFQICQPS